MQGSQPGTIGKTRLARGTALDRYGNEYGRYLTDPNTPSNILALEPGKNRKLHKYIVTKPFKVKTATIADKYWMVEGENILTYGGGKQYFTWRSVKRLVKFGYLREIV